MSGLELCKCTGSRTIETMGSWDHFPLEGGSHTAFMINRCKDCGGVCGFPQENFDLALEKGTPKNKDLLFDIIYKISSAPLYPPVN